MRLIGSSFVFHFLALCSKSVAGFCFCFIPATCRKLDGGDFENITASFFGDDIELDDASVLEGFCNAQNFFALRDGADGEAFGGAEAANSLGQFNFFAHAMTLLQEC